MDKKTVDAIVKQVFILDISKQLLEYGVEYHVLQEQMNVPRPEQKQIKQLEAMNKALMQQNRSLHQQLEVRWWKIEFDYREFGLAMPSHKINFIKLYVLVKSVHL